MATNNMQGKVCLVTGSSSGIGKVTARELAKMGATVVMVCRNRAKGEAVQAEIKEVSGNDQVDLIVADLSELSQVGPMLRKVFCSRKVDNSGTVLLPVEFVSDIKRKKDFP